MRGVVVTPQPRAAEVGAAVLANGGNAFDAAVATGFAQMVCDPWMCGVGGFGVATFRTQEGTAGGLGFFPRAGSNAHEAMWFGQDLGRSAISGYVLFEDYRNELGYAAVCTPGAVAGFWELHQRHGTMPWHELLEPAILMARHGVEVPPFVHRFWTDTAQPGLPDGKRRLGATPACAAIFLTAAGEPIPVGHLLVQPDYAATLEAIASGGADVFYRGVLAERIAADLASNGSFVTLDDLHRYRVEEFVPLRGVYRGHEIVTTRPPAGGVTLLQMLNTLAGYDLASMPHNDPEYLHLVAGAMRRAHADRRMYLGDPEHMEIPIDQLLSPSTALRHRESVDAGELPGASTQTIANDQTTHLSAFDECGNAVAITHSVGTGSGVVTSGLGFVYNNSMKHFDPTPGGPSSIRPRARPIGTACPTIVLQNGQPRAIVGAPGGSVIISATLQTLLNVIDHGMSAAEAVAAPRIHCEGGAIFAEARMLTHVADGLRKLGNRVNVFVDSFSQEMSAAHLVLIPLDGRPLEGGADPRRGGGVAFSSGSMVSSAGVPLLPSP